MLAIKAASMRWHLKPLPGVVKGVASLTVMMLLLFFYRGQINKESGLVLLALMIAMKLLEEKKLRDLLVLFVSVAFMMVALFFNNRSMLLAVYQVPILLMMFASLGEVYRSGMMTEGRLPANQQQHYQFSLLPRRSDVRQLLRMLTLASLFALVLFVFFPRFSSPLWGTGLQSGNTGMSDSMEPGSISELIFDDSPAFRAYFEGTPPAPAERYWRALVFQDYDGRKWTSSQTATFIESRKPSFEATHEYNIQLMTTTDYWLVSLDRPVSGLRMALLTNDGQLYKRRKTGDSELNYSLQSNVRGPWERQVSRLELNAALDLPTNNPKTLELGQRWAKEGLDASAISQRILQLFRNEAFYYTLDSPLLGTNPVDEFLFETRLGFCEHYTAAYVTLMRASGIPARVVAGYQGGHYNPIANYVLVRNSDAHAWAEIWVEGFGWQRVDPTAAVAPERIMNDAMQAMGLDNQEGVQSWWKNLKNNLDSLNALWTKWILNYNVEKQKSLLEKLGINQNSIMALLVIMTTLTMLLLLYAYFRSRHRTKAHPLDRVFQDIRNKLKKNGAQLEIWSGPEACQKSLQSCDIDSSHKQTLYTLLERYKLLRYRNPANQEQIRLFRKMARRHLGKIPSAGNYHSTDG